MADHSRTRLLDLLLNHYGGLVSHLSRQLGSASLASEAVQETFVKLTHSELPAELGNPRAYLYRMATNLGIDLLRRERSRTARQVEEGALEDVVAEDACPVAALERARRAHTVRAALQELPEQCRRVVLMHKFEGRSHAEIAAALGISVSTVEKHMVKALRHCRQRLDKL